MSTIRPAQRHSFPGGSTLLFTDRAAAEWWAGQIVAETIQKSVAEQGRAVIGLATGSTPIAVYHHLAVQVAAGKLSFDRVSTYNLDEYYPMSPSDPQSYRAFMDRYLFGPVKIAPNRTHVLDGTVPEDYAEEHARVFDRWIAAEGGFDLQLLGLGRNGHIGFNEPSDLSVAEALALPTRLVDLHPTTRADAVKDFGGANLVPRRALTVGPATILAARSILVLAFGAGKADAVAQSLSGPMTAQVPGSLLQSVAAKVTWLIDPAAASRLF